MYAECGGGYIAFSQYSEYVPMWENAFGKENVLLLRTEDLKRNQKRVASRCFDFLRLPDHPVEEIASKHKTSETVRNFGSMPRVFQMAASLFPSWFQETRLYERGLHQLLEYFTPSPPTTVPDSLREEIRDRLSSDLELYHNLESV
jgi:hypothetical protein